SDLDTLLEPGGGGRRGPRRLAGESARSDRRRSTASPCDAADEQPRTRGRTPRRDPRLGPTHPLRVAQTLRDRTFPRGDERMSAARETGGAKSPLSSWRLVSTLAAREITTKVGDRGFLISFVFVIALVFGVMGMSFAFNMGPSQYSVAVVDERDRFVEAVENRMATGPATVEVIEYADLAEAEAAVAEGTVDAALVEGREVVYQELPSPELETLLGDAHQHAFTVDSLGELGLDPAEALEFLSVPPLEQSWLDAAADRAHERLMVAVVGVLLLYVLVLVLGQSISQGVVEEKSSRIVEILLAMVRPWHLLAGKIVGLGLVGLAQMLLVIAVGAVAAVAFGVLRRQTATVSAGGARATRPEDLQSVLTPVVGIIAAAMGPIFFVLADPEGTPTRVFSLLPPFSPILMPLRAVSGAVSWWEFGAAATLMVVSIVGLLWVGGRVYAGGLMRTDRIVGISEALSGTEHSGTARSARNREQ